MGSTSLLLSPAMTSLVLLLTSSLLMTMVVCKPYNRYEAGRELASLATDNPGASIDLLRQIRRNIRKTQASLKLVISMEKELQRVARHITDNLGQEQGDDKEPDKEVRQGQSPPFSAWAG